MSNLRDIDFTPAPEPEEFVLRVDHDTLAKYRSRSEVSDLKDITAFISDVVGPRFMGVTRNPGDLLPWDKANRIGFRPGETTIWSGINGHGKSALVGQVAMYWGLKGIKSMIASFEMLPRASIDRMLLQACGNDSPSEEFCRQFFRSLKGKLYFLDRRDRMPIEDLFALIRFCAVELKVQHVWLDSLTKIVRGEDDYNGQKALVEDLTNLARDVGIHIHVVHHVKKLDDETRLPSKFDSKGSGAISDLADQFVTVWRNKRKERDLAAGTVIDTTIPDFVLVVDKNRHGGWEGKIGLYGDLATWHFRETHKQPWTRGYALPEAA